MSWLNLNDSLNNIKGQLTNFASGVLADDDVEETEADSRLQDLQNLTTQQETEIAALRRQNAELQQILLKKQNVENVRELQSDGWDWEPSNVEEKIPNELISNLKKEISTLESEKSELINNLEQLDVDCQETTDKLVTIRDELQTEYNTLKQKYDGEKQKNELLTKLNEEKGKIVTKLQNNSNVSEYQEQILKLTARNNDFEKELLELKTNQSTTQDANQLQEENEELTKKIGKLLEIHQSFKELKAKQSEMIHIEDYTKLEYILQEYENKVSVYEDELKMLKIINAELKKNEKTSEDITSNDKKQIDELLKESNKLNHLINQKDNDLILIKQEMNQLTPELEELRLFKKQSDLDSINQIKPEYEELKQKLIDDKNEMHNKYIQILRENLKKCTECQIPEIEAQTCQLSEFTTNVEAILKLILDFKWKCETLDKEVQDLMEEKTKILTDKNHEIEKLICNSEDLSKELITKGQDLKHYEEECNELIKNNELLIHRLDDYNNSSGSLQTISESNEDNLLFLETQLERACNRIKELELAGVNSDDTNETQTELAYIKKQLNLTGNELDETKKQYQQLMISYKELDKEKIKLQNSLENINSKFDDCVNEKDELNLTVDQIKNEFENSEYKYTEQNINIETLKEEIETQLNHITKFTKENKKLVMVNEDFESKNELMQKEIDDLKQELTSQLNGIEQKQLHMHNLAEKLQNSKMAETSLKLQCDTLHKEYQLLINHKNKAEAKIEEYEAKILEFSHQSNAVESILLEKQAIFEENVNLQQQIKSYEESNLKLEENLKMFDNVQDLIASKNELLEKLKVSEETIIHQQNQLSVLENDNKINLDLVLKEKQTLQFEIDQIKANIMDTNNTNIGNNLIELEAKNCELIAANAQLITLIQEKHQENINYHTEIQRISQFLNAESEKCHNYELQLQSINETMISKSEFNEKVEALEKLNDQNGFLREKSEILAQNLLQEQSNTQKVLTERSTASEREAVLQKKLDSLRQHLLEIEEIYTKEVQLAEHKSSEMQGKLQEVEQREKNSSTRYTSVNIRANQQVETMQTQMQLITNQRDEYKKKIAEFEDQIAKQNASLANLQVVLQQFQRDKGKDVIQETERIRRQIATEKQIQEELRKEILNLKLQLDESKQGLQAAIRLTDQMEAYKRQVVSMKEEATKLQENLKKAETKCNQLNNQTDGKVDKMLIKNLVIGMVSSNNNLNKDQNQILKIISTVLDFNQQDIEKVHLNRSQQQQGSWFSAVLNPQTAGGQNISQESISQAFVRFLEAESKPRELPNLLETGSVSENNELGNASKSSTPSVRQSPLLLSEIVLPTFADFGQNRNSSSILKDVLKDNSNS